MAKLCQATQNISIEQIKADDLGCRDNGGEFLPGTPYIRTPSDTKEKRLKCIFGFMISYSCGTESPSVTLT